MVHNVDSPKAPPISDTETVTAVVRALPRLASVGTGQRLLPAIAIAAVLQVISSVVPPPAYPQTCTTPDTCNTFSCQTTCGDEAGACVPTTEGTNVCIRPICVAPCTTSADCPDGSVCFTLGCCGLDNFCVPLCEPIVDAAPAPAPALSPGAVVTAVGVLALLGFAALLRRRRA